MGFREKIAHRCDWIDMIADYNSSMGDVDIGDMLIALYRTEIVSKKQWYFKIIFHMVDICKVNGWLLYRCNCNQEGILKKKLNATFRVYCIHSKFITTSRKDTFIWKTKEALLVTKADSRKESRSTKTYTWCEIWFCWLFPRI